MRAIILGIVASFFFASTFVLNRSMDISGGSWVWSAVLRFLFMLPFLLSIVILRGNLKSLLLDMYERPKLWFVWSTVGFGIFYAPICFAAVYGPSWLIASTWQITILSGSLLAPLFFYIVETDNGPMKIRAKVPFKGLLLSSVILIGVLLMQMEQAENLSIKEVLLGIIPVVLAGFAYPLGNRKMMEVCEQRFDTFQRVLGMTIASLPFWFLLAFFGAVTVGPPRTTQMLQSLIVAVCSGVIATILFFRATDLTKGDVRKLAAVEATQSGEVVFALLGELFILNGQFPTSISLAGIALVIIGIILHSFFSHESKIKPVPGKMGIPS